jgi:Tfp pilus assembly protein PilV
MSDLINLIKVLPEMVNKRGVNLVELMVAVFLVCAVVAGVSVFFPKSNRALVENRRRWAATELAASKMQDIKKKAYSLIPVTPQTSFTSPADAVCDCKGQDFSLLAGTSWYRPVGEPINDVVTQSSVTYTRQVCISYVQRSGLSWTSTCPSTTDPDPGMKNIRVRVNWIEGTSMKSVDMESLVSP